MPKLVDHEQRRAEIVDATLRLVARDGLGGATMRAIAKELGVANGAVGHYFTNQDALLAATYEEVFARTNARAAERAAGRRGLDALLATLRDLLPMEAMTVDEARIVVCFWGRITTDERLRTLLPKEHEAWTRSVQEMLEQAIEDGDLRAEAKPAPLAELLVTTVHAMQVRVVTLPDRTPPSMQRLLVEQILEAWTDPGQSLRDRWPADVAALHDPETMSLNRSLLHS
ncbi:TetR/AcrR family transcriptional regulator [Kribbella sp. CA-245084]|uniref:TetR/AcrR family transcriptional regulator n=1 Tax=Kribbella sp. CA-245084 TaxID=3239940 RepID=UPI003D929216